MLGQNATNVVARHRVADFEAAAPVAVVKDLEDAKAAVGPVLATAASRAVVDHREVVLATEVGLADHPVAQAVTAHRVRNQPIRKRALTKNREKSPAVAGVDAAPANQVPDR